jgi:hypothetical protein
MTDQPLVIEKVKADLAYRLPNSGAPLGSILLPRSMAERLVAEWEKHCERK